jgi:hypothetical protein
MELCVVGSLGSVLYGLLCVVVWPAMLLVMYRVAITVLSAGIGGHDDRRGVSPADLSPVAGRRRQQTVGLRR